MSFAPFSVYTLVQEHLHPYEADNSTEGHFDGVGIWEQAPAVWTGCDGAIVPLSKEQLRNGPDGAYTEQDRNLFTFTRHDIGTHIRYKGVAYRVHSEIGFPEYSQSSTGEGEGDLYAYVIKCEGRLKRAE